MEVFISWSGKRSLAAAEALREWLPKVIQAIDPWLSKTDLEKGTEWNSVIAGRLAKAKAGIFCLTPGNLHADSILFEAGAISRNGEDTYVCTLLIGLEYSQIQWPLAQFQHSKFEKTDLLELLRTLNKHTEKPLLDTDLEDVFQMYWPRLEEKFRNLPSESGPQAPKASVDVMMAEVLELVRNLSTSSNKSEIADAELNAERTWLQAVATSVRALDASIDNVGATATENGFSFRAYSKKGDRSHEFNISRSIPIKEIPKIVRSVVLPTVLREELKDELRHESRRERRGDVDT